MCKLRPERFRHVFNAAYRVNNGDRTWTPVPLLQIVLFPPSPSVAEVHGKMTGVFSSLWVPSVLSGEQHTPGLSLRMCVLSLTHIGCQRTDQSPHEMGFYIVIGLDLEATPSYTGLAGIQGIYHGEKHIIRQGQFNPLCTCQSWKKERKRGQTYLGPN